MRTIQAQRPDRPFVPQIGPNTAVERVRKFWSFSFVGLEKIDGPAFLPRIKSLFKPPTPITSHQLRLVPSTFPCLATTVCAKNGIIAH